LPQALVASVDHLLAAKGLADLNRERLATEHVHDRQRPEPLPVGRLVGNEVDAPFFVRSTRHESLSSRHDHLAPLRHLAARFGPS